MPDAGHKIAGEITRMRTSAEVSPFTEQVFAELAGADCLGSAAQHTWMSLISDGGWGHGQAST